MSMDLAYLASTALVSGGICAALGYHASGLRIRFLRDALMETNLQLKERNRRLVAISALETPGAAAAAKKMASIARGTHPQFRVIGKASTPIRPRAEIEVEAANALAERRAARSE